MLETRNKSSWKWPLWTVFPSAPQEAMKLFLGNSDKKCGINLNPKGHINLPAYHWIECTSYMSLMFISNSIFLNSEPRFSHFYRLGSFRLSYLHKGNLILKEFGSHCLRDSRRNWRITLRWIVGWLVVLWWEVDGMEWPVAGVGISGVDPSR
jgi:hypothetical protein